MCIGVARGAWCEVVVTCDVEVGEKDGSNARLDLAVGSNADRARETSSLG